MHERLNLILYFGLGVIAQAVFLIRNDWNWGKLLACLGIGVFGMLPGKHESNYEPIFHILMSLSFFAFMFALFFKEDILPVINEKTLLSYSLTFWYAYLAIFYKPTLFHNILLFLFLIPTGATLCIALIKYKLNFFWKLFFYSWFLIIVVSIGLFQFSYHHLTIFFVSSRLPWVGTVDCMLTGMAFLYLVVNATYIFELIPIPGKNQSWESRMQEWHDLTSLMTQRCNDEEPSIVQIMLLLSIQGTWLALNYYYHFLPRAIVINSLILLPVALSMGTNTTKQALQSFTQILSKDI